MNFRRCGLLAAAAVLTVFGVSRGEAQTSADAQITILQTTDLHHHANGADHVGLDVDPVTATSVTGAYSRIAAYVNSVRSNAGHPVVLVDSGDWTMGTLYDLTLGKQPLALYFLDFLKFNCVTLGNHEFDYAPQGLAQMLALAKSAFGFHTPIVASNMDLGGNTDLAPFVGDGKAIQTTRVEDLANGIRVGYIGLMGESAASTAPVAAPVNFQALSTHYAAIQALVDGLRKTQGVNVVIALSHSGTDPSGNNGEDVELARHVTGIDVIASGHTHTPLFALHTVTNAGWNTQIIDAGAYGSSVARIDLTYRASSKTTSVSGFSNLTMTTSGLKNVSPNLAPDPAMTTTVAAADQQLNVALGPFLAQTFPDYSAGSLFKGIYHSVGATSQDMVTNELDRVPSPNGLGDLAADAVRSIPNSIIAQTLTAVGGNPAKLPGYDFTPFQLGVVATGVLRGALQARVPLTFADVYNVLPLGISPDTSQSIPVGFPLISAYLELADVKQVCALQLLAQTNLIGADFYLNLSGIRYSLKATESYTYFKYAAAAAALQVISQKATSGSPSALQALLGVLSLGTDNGAALMAAYGTGNPYAGALVKLNDATPTPAQIGANLAVLGQVAAAGAADLAAGTNTLTTLVVSKAVAAIDTVSAFAPADSTNTGTATDLTGTARVRLAADLFAVLALGQLRSQFGVVITAHKSPTGSTSLAAVDLTGILGNRINAAPLGATVQELKEWMALLSYVRTALGGSITSTYASTPDFTQFGGDGAAVQTRNASYPIAAIGQVVSTLAGLQGTPLCASAPVVSAVTNATYGQALSGTGVIVVWGSGFFPGGGNAVQLTRVDGTGSVSLDAGAGQYFWDLSPNQINTALAGRVTAGQWMVSVRNACGATSAGFAVAIQ